MAFSNVARRRTLDEDMLGISGPALSNSCTAYVSPATFAACDFKLCTLTIILIYKGRS
jgi:hypothetical protein